MLNICVKFHENILNGFDVTERTRVCGRNGNIKCSKGNNSKSMQSKVTVPVLCTSSHGAYNMCAKECNPELRFLLFARRLILLNICMKFHENISNGSMLKGQ